MKTLHRGVLFYIRDLMSKELRTEAYMIELSLELKEKAAASIASMKHHKTNYSLGYNMAMYEVMSLMHQQAIVFDMPLDEMGLIDIDPERDYLCSNPSHFHHMEIIATIGVDQIPTLETFSYLGKRLNITVKLGGTIKSISCDHVVAFRMTQENGALKTLNQCRNDGKAWLIRAKATDFLHRFQAENQLSHADSLSAYFVISQNEIFEFLTKDAVNIN